MADEDRDPATPCSECPGGTYSGCSETECNECVVGQMDSDGSAATPCITCTPGTYWVNGTLNATSTCVQCPIGRADMDSDSTTECTDCIVGTYCALGTSVPALCADIGQMDEDDDPSTACTADAGVAVDAEVTLEVDIASIPEGSPEREAFETSFISDMALLLGVERSQIQIRGIDAGGRRRMQAAGETSVAVEFSVLPGLDGSSLPTASLEAAFENPVAIAGVSAGGLSGVMTSSFVCTQDCPQGFQDSDCANPTACVACQTGEYSAGGISPAGQCTECAAGWADEDFDGATECTACSPGFFAGAGEGPCTGCPAGLYTPVARGGSIAVCDMCQVGQYSGIGSRNCEFCLAGQADTDVNASTPCITCPVGTYAGCGEAVCSECVAGQVDLDLDSATPCTACASGTYWEAATALNVSRCLVCPAGRADGDADSTTGCVECVIGEYAAEGSSRCSNCTMLGLADTDGDPSTQCVAAGSMCTQPCDPGYGDHDCNAGTPCELCSAGRFRPVAGTGECEACAVGRYETAIGSRGCNSTCLASDGLQCAEEGAAYPHPAFGYYMESNEIGVGIESLSKCTPANGCLGGHWGEENCAEGYGDSRCARCLDRSEVSGDEDENGYYRKDGLCNACGQVIPVWILAVAGIIIFVVLALAADRFLSKVADVANFLAPFLIL